MKHFMSFIDEFMHITPAQNLNISERRDSVEVLKVKQIIRNNDSERTLIQTYILFEFD